MNILTKIDACKRHALFTFAFRAAHLEEPAAGICFGLAIECDLGSWDEVLTKAVISEPSAIVLEGL